MAYWLPYVLCSRVFAIKLLTSMRLRFPLQMMIAISSRTKRLRFIVDGNSKRQYFFCFGRPKRDIAGQGLGPKFVEDCGTSSRPEIIATDLSLCGCRSLPRLKIIFCGLKFIKHELHFDLLLQKGICKIDASFLLKKME